MTIAFDKDTIRRALSGHAALGLLAGALLYIVSLSGTAAVLAEEWQRIEQPRAPEMAAISPEAVQTAIGQVMARERGKPKTTHLYVHLPVDSLPRATVTTDNQAFHVDAAGRIAGPEENAWSDFLIDLHYRLHLPGTLGMIVVGALGAVMLALSISGVIAHPRIFRDAFRLRARHPAGVGLADWHNRLGVWTLPFAIAIALTGAVIGLALPTIYGIAARYYGGDLQAAYAPIFGAEAKPDAKPALLPDVVAPLRWVAQHVPQGTPTYVIVHDPGTAGQHVQVLAAHPRRLAYGENCNFDGAGRYQGSAGLIDGSLGQQAAASVYNLHFGNFAGLPVKILYVLFGLALCVITATGTSIWLDKRKRRGIDEPRLRSGWRAIVWGTPALLTLAIIARMTIGNAAPLAAIFWAGLAVLLVIALIWRDDRAIKVWLQRALAVGLAASLLASVVA